MTTELELKLGLDSQGAAQLMRSPLLLKLASGKPSTRMLRSIYFDTPDAFLRNSHAILRVRRAGGEWLQALKREDASAGPLHVRTEIEQRISSGTLDPAKVDDARFSRKLAKWHATGGLMPRFETVVRRMTWLLNTSDGSAVECALDRGQVRTADGRRTLPLCEVELELKSGSATSLFALAREFGRSLPVSLEERSKSERGYRLWLQKSPAAATQAEPILLRPNATSAEAMARIIASGLQHLQRNWRAAQATSRYDPEHVHQMRVASRRLRTAFAIFGRIDGALKVHPLVAELRWLAGLLGEARNWDVLLEETFPKLSSAFSGEPGMSTIVRNARIQRRRARLAVGEALRSRRYFTLALDLSEFAFAIRESVALSVPAAAVGADMLNARYRRLRKRAKRLAQLNAVERHTLRIASKKLRYAAEFFGSLFARNKLNKFLRSFREFQKALGLLNDLVTARTLISRLPAGKDGHAQHAIGLCTGWVAGFESARSSDVVRCWKSLAHTPPFWPERSRSSKPAAVAIKTLSVTPTSSSDDSA